MGVINKDFVTMRVKRHELGLEIFCKSEEIEALMKAQHNPGYDSESHYKTRPVSPDTQIGYYMSEEERRCYSTSIRLDNCTTDNWHDGIKVGSSGYNMAFIRTKGLSDGVTVIIRGVFSTTLIRMFVAAAKTFFRALFLEYIKPVEAEVKITTCIIESEQTNGK